jgi:hypothetical protein
LNKDISELRCTLLHLEEERSINMSRKIIWMSLIVLAVMVAGPVLAQEVIIYPAKGQSEDQMEQDKFQCYSWAKKETGFDPMEMPTATEAPPKKEAKQGGLLRGAARGAAVGGVTGAIAGDTKKGLAIGAAGGGLIGGMRRSDQRRRESQAQKQWEQEQGNAYMQKRNTYNRAYGACLEGRGYTVK